MLLEANIPRFWLPANKAGFDALRAAAIVRSRQCIKLVSLARAGVSSFSARLTVGPFADRPQLLDKINAAKREGRLAPVPTAHDRFLRNLMRLTPDFHDLVRGLSMLGRGTGGANVRCVVVAVMARWRRFCATLAWTSPRPRSRPTQRSR